MLAAGFGLLSVRTRGGGAAALLCDLSENCSYGDELVTCTSSLQKHIKTILSTFDFNLITVSAILWVFPELGKIYTKYGLKRISPFHSHWATQ